ncbi:MAG: hypothetical protein KKA84_01015 [Bacteroidetes bacterium]|nr:hypothetical protein [Bacteroidota bacterium]
MRESFVFFVFVFFGLMLLSCEEDPTSVGNDLLPPGDIVEFIELDSYLADLAQESVYFDEEVFLGAADEILVGKNSGLKSTSMMRFFIPITVETGRLIDSSQFNMISAKVILKPNYVLGDQTAPFAMTIHTINSPWFVDSFTVDSLYLLDYNQENVAMNMEYSDTLITFNLDTAMVLSWMVAQLDTNIENSHGILLKPDETSDKIIGFRAFGPDFQNIQPIMEIAYEGVGFDTEIFADTIWATLTSDQHIVEGQITETSEDIIILQGGLGGRGALKFDLSSIPANSIINNAQLEISYDSLNSVLGNPFVDSLTVTLLEDYDNRASLDSLGFFYLTRDGDIFSGSITRFVQRWLYDEENNGVSNNGVKLALADELEFVNKVVLYSSQNNDPLLKPRLKIIYSRKQ